MDKWNITAGQIAAIQKRTRWLLALVQGSDQGRITSSQGTDFTFKFGPGFQATPILGIIPLYGEVAVAPQPGSEEGVLVIDGPTQKGVRPRTELDREPLRITIEKGKVKKVSGDRIQLERLRKFIQSGSPRADQVDEVGLVTTQVPENDLCWWEDGTHHHDTVHVAIGNNLEKKQQVHGVCHMDGEIVRPTISIDGLVITRNGVFIDVNVTG
jgi:leucyl aminopeptidase (aminopeptidase T)